jgi:thermitase
MTKAFKERALGLCRQWVSSIAIDGSLNQLRSFVRMFFTFLLSLTLSQSTTLAQEGLVQTIEPGKIFVKFKERSPLLKLLRDPPEQSSRESTTQKISELKSFQTSAGISNLRALKPDASLNPLPGGVERIFIGMLAPGTDQTQSIQAIYAGDQVEYVEPVYVTYPKDVTLESVKPSQGSVAGFGFPNDDYISQQWGLHNTGQKVINRWGTPNADINAIPAWKITTGSNDILVAFLSTGLMKNSVEWNNLKYYGNRLYHGYNFVDNNDDYSDDNGFGTALASIAVATGDNLHAMAGVDWKCRILPVKVVNAGWKQSAEWIAPGLIYAADQGANVICFGCWAMHFTSLAMKDAVTYATSKGAILVNPAAPGAGYEDRAPAANDRVIFVGSTDNQDKRIYTTYGRIDFMAPGDGIMCLNFGLNLILEPYVGAVSGPLSSAPFVAGVVSLMLSLNKSLTFEEVYDILRESAADQVGWPYEDTPGWDQYYGWGRVDAYRAVRLVKERSKEIPEFFGTTQNYPNPFNPATTIEYDLPTTKGSNPSRVTLKIYNLLGQPVGTLVDELQAPGYHHAQWTTDGPSGVYFYRLQVDDRVVIKKMILAK